MIDTQVKCDVCKEIRGPSNHWILFSTTATEAAGALLVMPWDDDEAQHEDVTHVCGRQCAHKILDRYLESLRNGESNG